MQDEDDGEETQAEIGKCTEASVGWLDEEGS